MTSKISFYIKMIRKDIRHRGWLAALSCIVLFLMMPVYTMLYLSTYTGSSSELIEYLPGLLNGASRQYLALVIALLSVFAALTGFGYIHSREKLDFFHSLPVKRGSWFVSVYLSGLIIVLLPYVICSALTIIVSAADMGMSAQLAGRSAEAFLGGALAIFVIYSAGTFALMLTGKTVTGLLAALTVIAYPFITLTLLTALESVFYKTFWDEITPLSSRLADYLSPLGLFMTLLEASAAGRLSIAVLAAAVLMSALFTAGAVLLYRIYPSEAAGTAIAFPVISPAVKVIICIPTALYISLMIKNMMILDGNGWLFPLTLLAAAILCAVIDFIYTTDLRLLLKSWRSSLISVAGAMLILCFFQFDLSGYDTYIPEKSRVESISFLPDPFSGHFTYPDTEDLSVSGPVYFAPGDMTDTLYDLAQSGIDNLEDGITPQYVLSDADSTDKNSYITAVFGYKLPGGRIVTRQYALKYSDAAAALETLLASREYRQQLFPFFHIDKSSVTAVSMADVYGVWQDMKLTEEQRQALLDAYESDLLSVGADTFVRESPLGELAVDLPDPSQGGSEEFAADTTASYNAGFSDPGDSLTVTLTQLYLYPEFTDTFALLEDYGYTIRTRIDPADVSGITLHLSSDTVQNGVYSDMLSGLSDTAETFVYDDSSLDVTVSDEKDVSLVLKYIAPYSGGLLDGGSNIYDYMDIRYKDGEVYGQSFSPRAVR